MRGMCPVDNKNINTINVQCSGARREIRTAIANQSKALAMLQDDIGNNNNTNNDEVRNYIETPLTTVDFDVLHSWFEHRNKFPILYQLVRFLCAVPASSAAVERVFSLAGYTMKNRPNIKPSTLDDLLFLKSNYDLFEEATTEIPIA